MAIHEPICLLLSRGFNFFFFRRNCDGGSTAGDVETGLKDDAVVSGDSVDDNIV